MTTDETDDSESNVVPIESARQVRALASWEVALRSRLLLSVKTNPLTKTETSTIRCSAANVATILQCHPSWSGVVALNVFHLRIEATRSPSWHALDAPSQPKPGPWSDADTARLVNWFARTWICGMPPINVSTKVVDAALLVAAEANAYHPVRDYLRSLRWDGENRLDTWGANYLGGELTPYACAVGAAFLIGCVARVMSPGCKLDTCIVLEGKQGKYKSTALEVLAGEWFADSKLAIGDKDAMQGIAGVWIYEIAELASLGKADVETIKAFMSSRRDHYRPSYGRHAVDVPRQTAFAGTTNADRYLQDASGGRRFNPFRTGEINIAALRKDRDQLWAEALHRYEAGAPWWVDDALTAEEQNERYVVDEWQDRIAVYLRLRTRTTVGEILEDLIMRDVDSEGNARNTMGRWGQGEQNRVARCLLQLAWERKRAPRDSTGKSGGWYYSPAARPPAQI